MKINAALSFFLMAAGALAVIVSAVKALSQRIITKRLLYHAVSQAGYVTLGIGTLTAIGIRGSIFGAISSAICLGYLFLAAINIRRITGQDDLEKLGGLANAMPVTFLCWLFASLSVSAVWPLPGFFSVWMICRGLAQSLANPAGRFTVFLCLSVAVFGTVITLAGFMRLLQAVFFNGVGKYPPLFSSKTKQGGQEKHFLNH